MSDDAALIDRLKKVLIHLQEVDAYLARHEKPGMISWPARRAAMAEAVRAVLKLYLTDETGQVLQIDGKPLPESKALKLLFFAILDVAHGAENSLFDPKAESGPEPKAALNRGLVKAYATLTVEALVRENRTERDAAMAVADVLKSARWPQNLSKPIPWETVRTWYKQLKPNSQAQGMALAAKIDFVRRSKKMTASDMLSELMRWAKYGI